MFKPPYNRSEEKNILLVLNKQRCILNKKLKNLIQTLLLLPLSLQLLSVYRCRVHQDLLLQ